MNKKRIIIAGLGSVFLSACNHTYQEQGPYEFILGNSRNIDSTFVPPASIPASIPVSVAGDASITAQSPNHQISAQLPNRQMAPQSIEDIIVMNTTISSFQAAIESETYVGRLIGHVNYCESNGAQGCDAYGTPNIVLEHSPYLMSTLADVTRRGNQDIQPAEDIDIYGKSEVWALLVNNGEAMFGDCEDYSLYKRQILVDKYNVPPSALSIYAARREDGTAHAFLGVRTDQGVFVLDNLNDNVVALKDVPYTELRRQSYVNGGRWVSVTQDDFYGVERPVITHVASPAMPG